MQVKLLRAIDGGEYTPVGDNKVKIVNARIVAATNRDLANQVKRGMMREDFFYRIHVIPIKVPPLRDRKEDIPILVKHFLKSYGNGGKKPSIPGKIIDSLCNYEWPGNVRELQNALQRYISVKHLDFIDPYKSYGGNADESIEEIDDEIMDLRTTIQNFEKNIIIETLEKNQWHKAKAASMLGLPRRTFSRKLHHFGLN